MQECGSFAGKPAGAVGLLNEFLTPPRYLGACRHHASELAVSEVTLCASTELQQYLDDRTRALVEGLRGGDPADRRHKGRAPHLRNKAASRCRGASGG